MKQEQIFRYALIGILLLLLYFAFRILLPYLTAIILGLMLTYLLFPVYRLLLKKVKRPYLASTLMVALVIVLIIGPLTLLGFQLAEQVGSSYTMLRDYQLPQNVLDLAGQFNIDADRALNLAAVRIRDFFSSQAPDILGGLADIIINLFVMFFLMVYAFPNGKRWVALVEEGLPLKPKHRKKLIQRVGDVTAAVIYGQFLTAVIQGTAGGIMLWAFGIPNPIFWGAIMIIACIIPVLGSFIVWLPIALWQLLNGDLFSGIGIMLVGGIVIGNMDNVLRSYLVGNQAQLSALLVLLGVLGGLQLFGIIGVILGPLLLALLQTVIGFLRKEDPELT